MDIVNATGEVADLPDRAAGAATPPALDARIGPRASPALVGDAIQSKTWPNNRSSGL